MKTKLSFLLTALILLVGCVNQEKNNSKSLEELQNNQGKEINETNNLNQFQDSIGSVMNDIEDLKSYQEAKRQEIISLNKKKDSLNAILIQVQQSLSEVNAKKINPGIEGVNTKLAELKGQREDAQEKLELQKQEIILAEKKIVLLNEEKTVYDAQHQALWSKGAAPEEFKDVDTLLSGLNSKISDQAKRVKKLKSNVSDAEEQIQSIDIQRNSLSSKIRNNYTAKQIFDDYSKEEKVRLDSQLASIDERLKKIINEEAGVSNQLAIQSSKKYSIESAQTEAEKAALLSKQTNEAQAASLLEQEAQKQKDDKKFTALIIVGLLALIIGVFYMLGKMRKARKNK